MKLKNSTKIALAYGAISLLLVIAGLITVEII